MSNKAYRDRQRHLIDTSVLVCNIQAQNKKLIFMFFQVTNISNLLQNVTIFNTILRILDMSKNSDSQKLRKLCYVSNFMKLSEEFSMLI